MPLKIKSLLFSLIFFLWTFVNAVFFLPLIFFYPVVYRLNTLWGFVSIWLFNKIIGCDYRIEGLENLPLQRSVKKKTLTTGFVIASKHQSAWETTVAFSFLPKVCFVYKKELSYIPIYGWYHIANRNIKVDRSAAITSLKKVLLQAKERVQNGHQVIIFPQGTRTPFGRHVKYKSSIYAMYKEGLPIYPAALNSGNHWPKHGIKTPGTIIWKFFPRIEPGLSREDFMARLEAMIEVESNALNEMHGHGRCGCH